MKTIYVIKIPLSLALDKKVKLAQLYWVDKY